jgi:hypothetical protein
VDLLRTIFPPAKPDRYAAKVIRVMRKAGVGDAITYDPKEFKLTIGGEKSGSFHLRNTYLEYCSAAPMKRGELIRRWGGIALQMRQEPDQRDTADLLPRVRDRLYHELLRLQTGDCEFPVRPITEDLVVEVVCDSATAIQTLGNSTLKKWGIGFDEALNIGRENLWLRSKEDFVALREGLYRSPWQDNHDASRLFLHDLIWQLRVRGKHVAVVPNRDVLLVTGSEDAEGLLELARVARQVLEQPRPMSGIPVVLEGSTWKSFIPPRGTTAYGALRDLIECQNSMAYSEQREALTADHQRKGQDVFVPKYTVMLNNETGELWSWTTWVEGVTNALMPMADKVMFAGEGPDGKTLKLGFGDWETVRAVAGGLLEETQNYPARFRVRSFP